MHQAMAHGISLAGQSHKIPCLQDNHLSEVIQRKAGQHFWQACSLHNTKSSCGFHEAVILWTAVERNPPFVWLYDLECNDSESYWERSEKYFIFLHVIALVLNLGSCFFFVFLIRYPQIFFKISIDHSFSQFYQ